MIDRRSSRNEQNLIPFDRRQQREKYLSLASLAFEIQEGILVTDANGFILKINPAFTRLTGFNGQDVLGKTPRILSSGLQDKAFYQSMWQTITQQGYWQGEIWNRRKNGKIFPQWLTVSTILDTNGLVKNYVGSFIDISTFKQAEQRKLNKYRLLEKQSRQQNAELQQIKTELTEIKSTLKLLIQQQKSNQEPILFSQMLKKGYQHSKQLALAGIFEEYLPKVNTSYIHPSAGVFNKLTPKESEIAAMIQQGFSTKHIAAALSSSTGTINNHRKNIRKKLGLNNEPINLRSHLGAFD
ncbi:MAG: PAS domain S-box protein [Methylococcales bacterium]